MIACIDHFVLTVQDISRTVDFYTTVLDMKEISFGGGRTALAFGMQKINLHQRGHEFEPKAHCPTPGSADFCFLSSVPLEKVVARLKEKNVSILEGPVQRTGARGPILSIYLRDPDSNLIEIANYLD